MDDFDYLAVIDAEREELLWEYCDTPSEEERSWRGLEESAKASSKTHGGAWCRFGYANRMGGSQKITLDTQYSTV